MANSIKKTAGRLATAKSAGTSGRQDKSTVGKLKGKATAGKVKRQTRSVR